MFEQTFDFIPQQFGSQMVLPLREPHFCGNEIGYIEEPNGSQSNFWLNPILLPTEELKKTFLEQADGQGIGVRSLWRPMHRPKQNRDTGGQSISQAA